MDNFPVDTEMESMDDNMFSGETDKNSMTIIKELSELVCDEDAACAADKKALTDRQDKLKSLKIKLYDEMQEAGFMNVKLDNGLTPSRKLETKYFKAGGVDNEELFEWLIAISLGDIIKPTVHHGTLNSALKSHVEQGYEINELLINAVPEKGIRMNGKSKYLAEKVDKVALEARQYDEAHGIGN
jgi:hypothetical protein